MSSFTVLAACKVMMDNGLCLVLSLLAIGLITQVLCIKNNSQIKIRKFLKLKHGSWSNSKLANAETRSPPCWVGVGLGWGGGEAGTGELGERDEGGEALIALVLCDVHVEVGRFGDDARLLGAPHAVHAPHALLSEVQVEAEGEDH